MIDLAKAAFKFVVGNWLYILPAVGVLVLGGLAWRTIDNAYDRGRTDGFNAATVSQKRAYDLALARHRAQQAEGNAAAHEIGFREGQAQRRIETVTRTIIQRIPASVTPKDDAACPVPLGFVRIYDAAASGDPAAGFALRAPEPDAAATDVTLSEIDTVSADNLGACHGNAEQLRALQELVRDFQARQTGDD